METNSEEFTKAFAETWAEWVEKGNDCERKLCFPAEVMTISKSSGLHHGIRWMRLSKSFLEKTVLSKRSWISNI